MKRIFYLFFIFIFLISIPTLFTQTNNGFVTLKKIDNNWLFIDAEDKPFILRGIHHVNNNSHSERGTGIKHYKEYVKENYSSKEEWAEETLNTLKEIGFNTIGNWSQTKLFKNILEERDMYYVSMMYLPRGGWVSSGLDDYYSEGFIEHAENVIIKEIEKHDFANDKRLIGYFIGGELKWGGDWRGLNSIFIDYMNMKSDNAGKIEMINILKENCNNDIKKYNKIWLTSFKSWKEALDYQKYKTRTLKASEFEIKGNYLIASQFYRTSRDLIRKYDKNHLILGDMLLAPVTPREVLRACGEYMDLVSVNYYPLIMRLENALPVILGHTETSDFLQEFYDITQRPIMVSEFGVRARTKNAPSSRPGIYPTYPTQKNRGERIYEYISDLIDKNYMVGYIVFQWYDQPKKGEDFGVAENNNWGIVDINNNVHKVYAEYLKKANSLNK